MRGVRIGGKGKGDSDECELPYFTLAVAHTDNPHFALRKRRTTVPFLLT